MWPRRTKTLIQSTKKFEDEWHYQATVIVAFLEGVAGATPIKIGGGVFTEDTRRQVVYVVGSFC